MKITEKYAIFSTLQSILNERALTRHTQTNNRSYMFGGFEASTTRIGAPKMKNS
jgi:hypothetical protein